MRKFLLAVGVLALCGAGARAQRIEVFTGLSYGQFNPGANLTQSIAEFGRHFSMPGVEASGQLNLHSCTCANGQSTPTCSQKETRFSWGVGGGIDLNASNHISLRLVQIDYLRNAFTNCVGGFNQTTSTCAAQAGRQDNYRAAAGFVWHF